MHSVTGVLSRWILTINSKAPVSTQVMSNGYLTASAIEPQARERIIYGIGDEQGKISPIGFGLVFYLLDFFGLKKKTLTILKKSSNSITIRCDKNCRSIPFILR